MTEEDSHRELPGWARADRYMSDCIYCDKPGSVFERYCEHCGGDNAPHKDD